MIPVGDIVRVHPGGALYRVTETSLGVARLAGVTDARPLLTPTRKLIRVATGAKGRTRASSERPRAEVALATPSPAEPVTVEPRAPYGASGLDPSALF